MSGNSSLAHLTQAMQQVRIFIAKISFFLPTVGLGDSSVDARLAVQECETEKSAKKSRGEVH